MSSEVRFRYSIQRLLKLARRATYHLGWYPGAGRRNVDGGLSNIATYGYYWSATTASAGGSPQYGNYLLLYTGIVNPTGNNHRAYGFSVRCVAAFLRWMNKRVVVFELYQSMISCLLKFGSAFIPATAKLARRATYHLGWYPGAGYRNANRGELSSVGTYGYDWSATTVSSEPNPEYVSHLAVNPGNVYSANNTARAHGFSVRCVAAFLDGE